MPEIIQTPTGVFGATTGTRYNRMYNNQFFDYLSEQMPRNHREMFKWCEMVYSNTPVVVQGIQILINYSLTKFKYLTESPKVKEDTEKLLTQDLKIIPHLITHGMDYMIYGNTFRSIYFPFNRMLICGACNNEINITHADYEMKRGDFYLTCPECRKKAKATFKDYSIEDFSKIKLVSWNPYNLDIMYNPIADQSTYYYKLDGNIRRGIATGNKEIVKSIPPIFFDAFKRNKVIELGGNFRHIRTHAIAGFASGWGLSPLVPTLKLFLYTAILRKSVEAIGLEHITPQRILFPQGSSNDPSIMSSMGSWSEHIQNALVRWRQDPNYIMTAPYPTGVVNVGSQGRSLMPTNEIKQAEEDMLRALGVPLDLVYNSSQVQTSTVSLRMLENQLRPYNEQIVDYVNWIIDVINAKYDKSFCHVEFIPFTLVDDTMQKQMIAQLKGQGVSTKTVQESLSLDPEQERERLVEENVQMMEDQREISKKQNEINQNLAAQAEQEQQAEANNTIPQYDQQRLMAQAQNIMAEIVPLEYEERKSASPQLRSEDYVMYSMVRTLLESSMGKEQKSAAKEQRQQAQPV